MMPEPTYSEMATAISEWCGWSKERLYIDFEGVVTLQSTSELTYRYGLCAMREVEGAIEKRGDWPAYVEWLVVEVLDDSWPISTRNELWQLIHATTEQRLRAAYAVLVKGAENA